jgi:hypothetical protein
MSTTTVYARLAISRLTRHPYFKVRVLVRSTGQPGELVIPLALKIDDALLRRETARVLVEMPTPDTPTVRIEGQ